MSVRDEKATRYIAALDAARCSGNWEELPELIRKVTKHAPQRKCLIQTATAEHRAARYASSTRSNTPSKSASTDFSSIIPSLLSSIDSAQVQHEEFEAQACLAWIHWLLMEPGLSTTTSPKELATLASPTSHTAQASSGWTEICQVKAAYIKGASQHRMGQDKESLETFRSVLPMISSKATQIQSNPQWGYWSEQLLAQLALLDTKGMAFNDVQQQQLDPALQAFRHWAVLVSKSKEVLPARYGNTSAHTSRQSTWQGYYRFLSNILQQDSDSWNTSSSSERMSQSTELRRVEAHYEAELLLSTRFPKAIESNVAMEDWVELVISNWAVLCGQNWHDSDLGEGGRNAVGHNVLDILYRAAGKTFHSTLILRRLFQVHKSLADFDLAYRALKTYIELIERGRARAAKSHEDPSDQDDSETVFRTVSEGIEGLCAYGGKSEAQNAYNLATKLDEWLKRLSPDESEAPLVNGHPNGEVDGLETRKVNFSPETFGLIYRAIGIGQAHWARWTPFSESRSSLQRKATVNLVKASKLTEAERSSYFETVFALGMLLADTREINPAIEHVKEALTREPMANNVDSCYVEERKKIPLWHLLALLLTARQDFDTAARGCAAAIEQFPSSAALFGSGLPKPSSRLVSEKANTEVERGIVDDMECSELQRILEVRITELALIEVIEGPEEALNSSDDLLRLYFRLFGHLDVGVDEKLVQKEVAPPPSYANTVKSLRGSIFGKRRQPHPSDTTPERANGMVASVPEDRPARTPTQTSDAPTIKITDQDEKFTTPRGHRFRRSEHGSPREKLHRKEGSITRVIRQHSRERNQNKPNKSSQKQSFETSQEKEGMDEATQQPRTMLEQQHNIDEVVAPPTSLTQDSAPEAKESLSPTGEKLTSHKNVPRSSVHVKQHSRQDMDNLTKYPHTFKMFPPPRFSQLVSQKYALAVLVKTWLVIAKLYRRANLFDDSREASDEAAKAVQKIETLVAGAESSARAFADSGWGGVKSSDEVWADVFCERAELALAIAGAKGKESEASSSTGDVREAVEQFEQCLMFFPNHARGIVGLSNVLLDYCERKVELGRRIDDGKPKKDAAKERRPSTPKVASSQNGWVGRDGSGNGQTGMPRSTDEELKKTPENLNRLAARDRAYGLLSTLTKLGSGWDDSEAWYALARAQELGGEIEKAKEILWWCVELEDKRPIRHWSNVACTGYVL